MIRHPWLWFVLIALVAIAAAQGLRSVLARKFEADSRASLAALERSLTVKPDGTLNYVHPGQLVPSSAEMNKLIDEINECRRATGRKLRAGDYVRLQDLWDEVQQQLDAAHAEP